MQLFLHAGTEKTGTTSIQEFLRLNRLELRQRGVFVAETLAHGKSGNHRRLTALVADEETKDDFYLEADLLDRGKRGAQIEHWRAAFESERMEAAACGSAIISSEHLHSRLRRRSELERLRDFIQNKFETVSVVLYLRDPLEVTLASVSTIVKSGGPLIEIPAPDVAADRFLLDHRKTLELWEGVFGRERIIPRLFIPSELKGGSVVDDFAEVCGLDTSGLVVPARKNESLSLAGLQILARVNQLIPRVSPQGGINPGRGGLTDLFSDCFTSGSRLFAKQDLVELYEQAFSGPNEWVRERYFPKREALFFQASAGAPADTSKISEDDLSDMSALVEKLWNMKCGPTR